MSDKPTYEELEQRVKEFEKEVEKRKQAEEALEKRIVALTMPLDDAERINFEDLFNLDDIQRLQDEFASATGVASIITHMDGTPITRPSNFCRLCNDIIRKTDKGRANCYKSDAVIGRLSPKGPIIQPCMSGGLWDAGAGISVGGRHIANWLIGQVRDATQTEDKMLAYAREIGADESTLVEAFHEVPSMSRERFGQIAQVLFTIANQLSTTAHQNVQQARFITKRKQAEEALRESEEKLKAIFEAIADPVVMYDTQGHPQYLNPSFTQTFEWSLNELQGKRIPFVPDDQKEITGEKIKELYDFGKPIRVESKRLTKEGQILDVLISAALIESSDGEPLGMVVNLTDITKRKALEAQLQHAQKLDSIGLLAGGMAHDFNNLLYVIMGNISMAKDGVKPANGIAELLNEAEKASQKVKELANQLITFSEGGAPVKKVSSIGNLVKETTNLILSDTNVKSEFIFPDDLRFVEFDEGQMKQAVKNLTVNAVESMPDGGAIVVKAENFNISSEIKEKSLPLSEGKYVKISIRDHGVGIFEEHLSEIFDPYFSTKERGIEKGMGLGLATTYSIINRHAGHITVESEVGVGTTFTIYLPAAVEEIAGIEPVKMVEPEKPAVRTGRILVMDDEEMNRRVSKEMLSRLGYEPELAEDGAEAIELYKKAKESGAPFDAVILDLTIKGGMGGKDAVKALLGLDPQIKAIVSSGYSSDPVMTDFRAYGFIEALPKPYSVRDLKDMLNKILGKS